VFILSIFLSAQNVAFSLDELPTESLNDDVNKNIILPNVSPGGMQIDMQRTRNYFNVLDRFGRTKTPTEKAAPVEKTEPLELPKRMFENEQTQHINNVEISESAIFSESEIAEFKNLVSGKDVTAEDLNNLIYVINEQYKKKNCITAKAYMPVNNLEGGVLKIELLEAKIGDIKVEGNTFNRKFFLKSRLSQKKDDVLDLKTLEEDLKLFNKNARSIQLSAKLEPGEEYGTSNVILKADEKCPYHFTASWDSFGRETTGLLRGGLMASADSLFGFQDRMLGAVSLARSSVTPFVDYNIPINRKGTRVGASYMFGRSEVTSGQYKDNDIVAKTHLVSGYISHPLFDNEKFNLSLNSSINYKTADSDIYNFTYSKLDDYNISVGLGGRYNYNKGVLFASSYVTNGIIRDKIRSNDSYFFKYSGELYYIHYLPKGIILTARAGGQYSPQDIPFIEQYQIGGMSSVRGYSESLLLGPASYYASLEMLFPVPFLPREVKIPFAKNKFRLRDSVKLAVFCDNGAVFYHKESTKSANFLTSVGAGIRIAISKYLTARAYLGVPIMNRQYYDQAGARFHFDLIATPF